MNKKILAVSTGAMLSLLLVTGCQSAEEKNEAARKKWNQPKLT